MLRSSLFTMSLGLTLLAHPGYAGDDTARALAEAGRKTAALAGYGFKIEIGLGLKSDDIPTLQVNAEGKYEKGQPVFFLADKIEFYKKGDVLVYKDGGQWLKSRTGTLSDPLRILGGASKVRSARLPHDELTDLVKVLTDVKQTEGKPGGLTLYTGTLNEEAAKKMAPTTHRTVAKDGQAKLWVGADGQVHKYSFTIRAQGTIGNAEYDAHLSWVVTLRDRGATRIAMPEGAKKALE